MVRSFSRASTAVTVAGHVNTRGAAAAGDGEPKAAELAAATTVTRVPGARLGGNRPASNATAAIAWPGGGTCGAPSTARVNSVPAGSE